MRKDGVHLDLAFAGQLAVMSSLVAALLSLGSSAAGVIAKSGRLTEVGRRALIASAALLVTAVAVLLFALTTRDFSLVYVAGYTSRSTPRFLAIASLWAGMEGSLLWWTCLSAIYAATAVTLTSKRRSDLTAVATAVLAAVITSFLALVVLGANPFERSSPIPGDGAGLNPLLQSPFMWPHPILLYLGLTGFVVPFSFGIAALITGQLDATWFTSVRRWTLLSWGFLWAGIVMGGAWAYQELGWGGYWGWDPVENSSLLPWLTGTAFLHSVLVQERRGMLKVWNVVLVILTYGLAIFGTFLTRSGLLQSVHTFSESPLGKYFLPVLAVILIGGMGLVGFRYQMLRSQSQLGSLASREAMFLYNNLLFVVIAMTVLWGTLYPILVEAIQGDKISIGAPFYNKVLPPVGLALLALTGVGPMVAWRRGSWRSVRTQMVIPLAAGAGTLSLLAALGSRPTASLFAFGLCAFVAAAILQEFAAAAGAHSRLESIGRFAALAGLFRRNRRRYGGYVVHLGVVLIFMGLAGGAFKQQYSGNVQPGESFSVGPYRVMYSSTRTFSTAEKEVRLAVMDVYRDGKQVDRLTPQRNFHFAQRQPQSEIGLRSRLDHDLYIVLSQIDDTGRATLRAWINPLVMWIWIGGTVMTVGVGLILSGKPPRTGNTPRIAATEAETKATVPV